MEGSVATTNNKQQSPTLTQQQGKYVPNSSCITFISIKYVQVQGIYCPHPQHCPHPNAQPLRPPPQQQQQQQQQQQISIGFKFIFNS